MVKTKLFPIDGSLGYFAWRKADHNRLPCVFALLEKEYQHLSWAYAVSCSATDWRKKGDSQPSLRR